MTVPASAPAHSGIPVNRANGFVEREVVAGVARTGVEETAAVRREADATATCASCGSAISSRAPTGTRPWTSARLSSR